MNAPFFVLEGFPIDYAQALAAALGVILALCFCLAFVALRPGRRAADAERQRELEGRLSELNGRVGSLGEWLGSRQADLARMMAERLDHVGARIGAGLETHAQTTGENLARLNERLAVIDAAQARMAGMTEEVVSLKTILANKQSRGAFGQGRMETIVRDGLPVGAYAFQYTLPNKSRPDCVIHLPGDPRPLVVDAKFPLEAFSALRKARDEEGRKTAAQQLRGDVGKHVKDIADRYLAPGETQDIALMFVPSESVYADLVEFFDDVVQRAHRLRVVIVSPSLLMMAIQVTQSILRDAQLRDSVHIIQAEVGKLILDARRLAERVVKLETHFRQAQEDLSEVTISADKVTRRAERIDAMEFTRAESDEAPVRRAMV